jgi:hypothetical protein
LATDLIPFDGWRDGSTQPDTAPAEDVSVKVCIPVGAALFASPTPTDSATSDIGVYTELSITNSTGRVASYHVTVAVLDGASQAVLATAEVDLPSLPRGRTVHDLTVVGTGLNGNTQITCHVTDVRRQ